MKPNSPIQIRAGDLKQALTGLGKVINGRASIEALRCVKVQPVNATSVQLTATDSNVYFDQIISAEVTSKTEPFLLPVDALRDQTRNVKATELILLTPIGNAPPVSEFPETPAFRAAPITLPDDVTARLLRAFTCASHDETRYVLRGAFIDVSSTGNNAHRIIATDGRHLFSSNSMQLPNIKAPIILPDHKLWQWRPIAESRPWTLRISPLKNDVTVFRIDGPNWSVTGKTIEGSYPNYRQVVPQPEEFKTHVHFSNAALDSMIERIPTLPGKTLHNRPVGIMISKGTVSLLARETNEEPWKVYPIGKCESKGPDVTVLANRDYLIKCARFGLNDLALIDDLSPLRFTRGSDLMIVMPIRNTGSEQIARPGERPKSMPPVQKPRNQLPRRKPISKPQSQPRPQPQKTDPIKAAETQIAEAKQALSSARQGLQTATTALKSVRKQQRDQEKEVRSIRSTLRSLWKSRN